jgi:hypothetical protein
VLRLPTLWMIPCMPFAGGRISSSWNTDTFLNIRKAHASSTVKSTILLSIPLGAGIRGNIRGTNSGILPDNPHVSGFQIKCKPSTVPKVARSLAVEQT